MHLTSLRSAGISLPPGRMITSDGGHGSRRPLWLSDGPVTGDLWGRICGAHATSGLWPLLLLSAEDDFRPWATGELRPEDTSWPDDHDAPALLAAWWRRHASDAEDAAPAWPDLTPAPAERSDADVMAAEYAEIFTEEYPQARLGLVEAPRSADTLTALGWAGPSPHESDTAKYSAVLRSWEDRFEARVVALSDTTLFLSVAAPPTTEAEALTTAAEHFAVAPTTIREAAPDLPTYAQQLIDINNWELTWP
ncbi:DUF4253 domain-containing protein [Streptomyces sp. NPDC049881]|uniref:DUF4253 domain-containing protein n=1 Tax=Streptomyces sp. NPDC049881 TaxID=3155778 RepID=UPI0034151E27